MKKTEYSIGDVSALTGVSRDTLRFYEKKNILPSRKRDNGYRYYSTKEIFILWDILFYRRLNMGLESINTRLYENNTYEELKAFMHNKVLEEKAAVEYHQLALAKLTLEEKKLQKIDSCLNVISVMDMPKLYKFSEATCFQESLLQWFHITKEKPGLEMLYIFETFSQTSKGISPGSVYLMLREDAVKSLHLEQDVQKHPCLDYESCIYTIVESATCSPDKKSLQNLFDWSREHGIVTENLIYANYISHIKTNGKTRYYLELFSPVKSSGQNNN